VILKTKDLAKEIVKAKDLARIRVRKFNDLAELLLKAKTAG
jgi:hypothetical protein